MAEIGNAIVSVQKIESAEQAETYASDKFERLAAFEKEIEVAMKEIRKISGMEYFTAEKIMSMDVMEINGLSNLLMEKSEEVVFEFNLFGFLWGFREKELIANLQQVQKKKL